MSSCCSSSNFGDDRPSRHRCPVNSKEYREVSVDTIMHHLKKPWRWDTTATHYYFCDDPDCHVVYFGDDDSVIDKSLLRTRVGVKEKNQNGLLCYCFDVTRADFEDEPSTKDYVIAQTKAGKCACEIRNPSGLCCLKDFPKS